MWGRMKIGELAARTGLNPSAIRYYEKIGVLESPHRASGQRRYPDEALDRVLLVRFASEMGFTLPEITLFLQGLRDGTPVGLRWRKFALRKITEVDETMKRTRRLKSLLEHLLRCRCGSLQVCVQRLSLSPNLKLIRKQTDDRRPHNK
jgi:MerR family redox-sensitive transcriptional activator SoxR